MIRWPSGIEQRFENLTTNAFYQIVEPDDSAVATTNEVTQKPLFSKDASTFASFSQTEIEFNDFDRQPLLPNKHSQLGPGIAWADIDSDGDFDCFIGGPRRSPGKLLKNNGDQTFEAVSEDTFEEDLLTEDLGALFLDVDGDKDQDLYVVSGGVECEPGDFVLKDRLYLNDGKGNFTKSEDWLPNIRQSGCGVAATDFDKDGDLDIVIGGRIIPGSYPESPKTYLLENVGDKFEDATEKVAPGLSKCGMVNALVCSDVDGDGWDDLLLATEWGPVRFFKNESGKLVERTDRVGLGSHLGWYNSICGGDVDNDGDIDFVVGNIGLNTKYKATFEKPELLYYGDFEGIGRKRIVEAKYENGVCLPRRGLSCSSHAMPMIKEKTPTYHEFAISSLDSLYTETKLDEATRFEANYLESCILINESQDGEVQFRVQSLPRIAQASPIFGCQLLDVDGDGNLDVYAAQNFYGPQRETGYFDGGVSLLMKGDGTGKLATVDAATSGVVVTGDATSVTVMDLDQDSRPDILVGRNNDSPIVFNNETSGKPNHTVVDLTKHSDSGILFGTRITAKYSDGSKQLSEYRSNNGYLSQSVPQIFIGNGTKKQLVELKIRFPNGNEKVVDLPVKQNQVSSK